MSYSPHVNYPAVSSADQPPHRDNFSALALSRESAINLSQSSIGTAACRVPRSLSNSFLGEVSPNPSIERTYQRPLRALWPAAHVER